MKYLQLIEWHSSDGVVQEFRLVEHISAKWRKIGIQINITANTMEGWWSETLDTEKCWERVMRAWLKGRARRQYPPTWEGLYKLLLAIRKEGKVISALKEAVDKAVLTGTYILVDCGVIYTSFVSTIDN